MHHLFISYAPPIHPLFTAYSPLVHLLFTAYSLLRLYQSLHIHRLHYHDLRHSSSPITFIALPTHIALEEENYSVYVSTPLQRAPFPRTDVQCGCVCTYEPCVFVCVLTLFSSSTVSSFRVFHLSYCGYSRFFRVFSFTHSPQNTARI